MKVTEQPEWAKMRARAMLSRAWASVALITVFVIMLRIERLSGGWQALAGVLAGWLVVSVVHHTSRSGALLAMSITTKTLEDLEKKL